MFARPLCGKQKLKTVTLIVNTKLINNNNGGIFFPGNIKA